jgi:hypothetical protein
MKRAIYMLLFVGALILVTGNLTGQSTVKETRKVSGFTEIRFGIAGNLYVKTGPEFSLTLEGDKSYLAEIETVVTKDRLVIRMDNFRLFNNEKVNVFITLPELKGLAVSGSGVAKIENTIKADALYLDVSGSGKLITADLSADKLDCSVSGSGDIDIKGSGNIDKGEISISGSGSYSGETVKYDYLHVVISGSGRCTCSVTESLDASISGSGNVYYIGNPKINARVSGSGHVRSK